MSKHTPGPWKLAIDEYPKPIENTTGVEVCRVGGCPNCPDSHGENYANIHLIAAAPDLLEACKRALACFRLIYNEFDRGGDGYLLDSEEYWPLAQLRAAINKAEKKD